MTILMDGLSFRTLFSLLLLCLVFFLLGCNFDERHVLASVSSKSKPYQEFMEDPVTLTTIKTIAVFPFDDRAPQKGFAADAFANKLANHLASAGRVRVLYPRDVLEYAEKENKLIRKHNAELKEKIRLGLYKPTELKEVDGDDSDSFVDTLLSADMEYDELKPRQYYDPVRRVDEAIKLARRVKADAIIMGEVSDFDPYMRPKISLTMRIIATGNTDVAAQALSELTQWGIPHSSSSARGIIYIRQETFDSAVGSVGLDVSKYGLTHFVDHRPYDTEVYLRSMTMYYDVVASSLAKSYIDAQKKAIKEAEKRAREAAKRRNEDQEAAVRKTKLLIEQESRIPDFETDRYGEDYFDQKFVNKHSLIASNNGDKRIMSWRGEGRNIRSPSVSERAARDSRLPDSDRGIGLEGGRRLSDGSFPDADMVMENNLGDHRDRSWRPDYYNHNNPSKSSKLYDNSQLIRRGIN